MAGCACILELFAEPLYILSQNLLLLKLRLMVETVATLTRCVTMYILIVRQVDMVKFFKRLCLQFGCIHVITLLNLPNHTLLLDSLLILHGLIIL